MLHPEYDLEHLRNTDLPLLMINLLAATAWSNRKPIDQGGLLKFVFDKEYHAFNPDVINAFQGQQMLHPEYDLEHLRNTDLPLLMINLLLRIADRHDNADLEKDQKKLAATAWSNRKPIDQGGLLKFVFDKEYHAK
jgi:glutamate synthase domain-containing protein 2